MRFGITLSLMKTVDSLDEGIEVAEGALLPLLRACAEMRIGGAVRVSAPAFGFGSLALVVEAEDPSAVAGALGWLPLPPSVRLNVRSLHTCADELAFAAGAMSGNR